MSANGRLSAAELAPVATYPGNKLRKPGGAAAGMNTLNLYLYWELPKVGRYTSNGPDSDYRPYARQVYYKNYWCGQGACGNAATPGTSNHGEGWASDGQRWKLLAHGSPFGWGGATDAPWESWHTKYSGGFWRPNPGPDPHYPVLQTHSGGRGQARHVRKVQTMLRSLGWHVSADGDFGGHTHTAVHQFQTAVGYKHPTGIVARGTWLALAHAVALNNRKRQWRRR